MSRRSTRRKAAQQRPNRFSHPRFSTGRQFYRQLRLEPLEDRHLLAITVTTLADTVDLNDGLTSLREAIFAANTVPGVDTIDFAPALTAAGPATILLTQGELKITDSLTINGPGADLLTIDASGNDPTPELNDGLGSRVFNVDNVDWSTRIDVTIFGLRMTGGDVAGTLQDGGGGIRSRENLTLIQVSIDGNYTTGSGGGIDAQFGNLSVVASEVSHNSTIGRRAGGGINVQRGVLKITNSVLNNNVAGFGGGVHAESCNCVITYSTLDQNTASSFGGGAYLSFSQSAIDGTTISNNGAAHGGGIYSVTHFPGLLTRLTNSTISGNHAGRGGGILSRVGRFDVEHCTVTNNEAPDGEGSGIYSFSIYSQDTRLSSSIVSGNIGSDIDTRPDYMNAILSLGHNLVGEGNAAAAFSAVGDKVAVLNPRLGPLADNGGLTNTHALLPGSPAINAGDLNAVAGQGGVPDVDQRGEPFGRIVGGWIDIGAFEYQTPTALNLLVDTLADESDGDFSRGDLSLREAIELANKYRFEGVVDTIHFDPALTAAGPATILLTQGELKITDSLTINGPGADLLTIDASGNDPTPNSDPFDNVSDDSDGTRIFLISDGHTESQNGVHMAGMTLTGGEASGEFYQGGGILSFENLTLDSVRIVDNVAGEGGGVAALDGRLQFMNCEFIGNSAFFGSGGGLSAYNTQLSIQGSSFRENVALSAGGAIAVLNTGSQVAVIEATEVTGNIVRLNGGRGGGIIASVSGDGGMFELVDSNISNNELQNIGGFSQLDAGGGGIHLTVSNGAMGAIRESRANQNHLAPPASGGLVSDGGGLWAQASSGSISVADSQFNQNSSSRYGGGVLASGVFGGQVRIERAETAHNIGQSGGGIAMVGNVSVIESRIQSNSADQGGGLWIGGGQFNATTKLVRSAVDANFARLGGGLYATGPTRLEVQDSTLSHNQAETGGGIWSNGNVVVRQSTISGNTAAVGGGMFVNSPNPTIISHSTVAFNQATGVGNGLHLQSNVVEMNHSILASNTGAVIGDATVVAGASLVSRFSLIGRGQGSGLTPTASATPDANGNIVGSGANGIDPRLSPLADNGGPTNTHALLPNSPGINAGDPAAVAGQGGVPTHDQRGAPFTRVYGGRIDIGAVESIPIGFLPGDYCLDGVVDAMDYAVWRDTLGNVVSPGTGADGNGDGVVDEQDYTVWKSNFGAMVGQLGAGSLERRVNANAIVAEELSPASPEPLGRSRRLAPPFVHAPRPSALPGVLTDVDRNPSPTFSPRDRALAAWFASRRSTALPESRADAENTAHDSRHDVADSIDAALEMLDDDRRSARRRG